MSTKIQWTDKTWNPVRGCSLVSAGCANCYAMKQAHRFSAPGQPYHGLTMITAKGPHWNGRIKLVEKAIEAPLHWKKPCKIFVNSMSDLFHEDVPDQFIIKVLAVMALAPRHTFQVLTKRPERMRKFMGNSSLSSSVSPWPLPNVWFGVSVEDQKAADERIPLLLQTPAAVRWISAEPLLGPVDIETYIRPQTLEESFTPRQAWNVLLDWVVVGGESGPGARPCDVAWIRSVKEQCQAAGVPVFVKQLGAKPTQYMFQNIGTTPYGDMADDGRLEAMKLKDKKGGDLAEWPADLRVREYPGKETPHD